MAPLENDRKQRLTKNKPVLINSEVRGTISTALVAEALADVGIRGGDPASLLKEIGLSLDIIAVDGGRVSVDNYARLWRTIAAAIDDEFFGMNSRKMRSGSFDFIARSILGCAHVRGAVRHILAFFSLTLDDMTTRLQEEDGLAILAIEAGISFRAFAYFTYWLLVIGLLSWLVGRRIPVLAVDLTCPRPPDVHCADYQTLFTTELRFQQPINRLFFDSQFLDLPIRRTPANLREFLRDAPANILVRYHNPRSFSTQVTRRLREQSPEDWPDLEDLALYLHISPATLRRRLEREGTSLQEIKDMLRRDIAVERLKSSKDSISKIASEVGFADTSSFFRAFKKWTGINPGEYRKIINSNTQDII